MELSSRDSQKDGRPANGEAREPGSASSCTASAVTLEMFASKRFEAGVSRSVELAPGIRSYFPFFFSIEPLESNAYAAIGRAVFARRIRALGNRCCAEPSKRVKLLLARDLTATALFLGSRPPCSDIPLRCSRSLGNRRVGIFRIEQTCSARFAQRFSSQRAPAPRRQRRTVRTARTEMAARARAATARPRVTAARQDQVARRRPMAALHARPARATGRDTLRSRSSTA